MMRQMWALGNGKGRFLLRGADPTWFPWQLTDKVPANDPRSWALYPEAKWAKQVAKTWNGEMNKLKAADTEKVKPILVLHGISIIPPSNGTSGTGGENIAGEMGVPNDLVWRQEVYNRLHGIGGTGADPETEPWAKGWDDAIDEAIREVEAAESAGGLE